MTDASKHLNDLATQLNDLCGRFGCPVGAHRIDWLRDQLTELKTLRADLDAITEAIHDAAKLLRTN